MTDKHDAWDSVPTDEATAELPAVKASASAAKKKPAERPVQTGVSFTPTPASGKPTTSAASPASPSAAGGATKAKRAFSDFKAKAATKAAAFKESLTKGAPTDPAKEYVPTGAPAPAPSPRTGDLRRTRKARLRLTRVDPWSVMKTAFLFSIAFGIMFFVAVYVVWGVIEVSGLFDSVNNVLNTALGNPDGTSNFQLQDYINTGRVLGYTALLSALNIVLTTALATLFAFLYNLSATVLGGLEVTLAED